MQCDGLCFHEADADASAGADRKEIANRYFQWSHFQEAGTDAGAYTSFFKLQIMYVVFVHCMHITVPAYTVITYSDVYS